MRHTEGCTLRCRQIARCGIWLVWSLLVLGVMPSFAQDHPCDQAVPTVYRYPSAQTPNLGVGFCFDGLDTNGLPIEGDVGFKLEIEGGAVIDLGPVAPLTEPNAGGDRFYQIRTPTITAGPMHLHAYAASGESAGSLPVTLTLLGPPKPPKRLSIDKIGELVLRILIYEMGDIR